MQAGLLPSFAGVFNILFLSVCSQGYDWCVQLMQSLAASVLYTKSVNGSVE